MSRETRQVDIVHQVERRVITCDGPGCKVEVISGDVDDAIWYSLTKGRHGECDMRQQVGDACSHACLLRLIQKLEVAG